MFCKLFKICLCSETTMSQFIRCHFCVMTRACAERSENRSKGRTWFKRSFVPVKVKSTGGRVPTTCPHERGGNQRLCVRACEQQLMFDPSLWEELQWQHAVCWHINEACFCFIMCRLWRALCSQQHNCLWFKKKRVSLTFHFDFFPSKS